jgi:ankyrin repeat protein
VLVEAGADANVANRYGVSALLAASRIGDAAMVDLLLRAGADPRGAHPEGETPLMAASRAGSVPVVRALVAAGADVNAAESFQQTTALMWASAEGHVEVVDALIAAGADPNRRGHITSLTDRHNADHPTGGFTALMWAARNGHEQTVRRLLAGGADINLKNGDGASAAMVALWNHRLDMAALLLDLGSDANDGSLYVAVEMRDATTDQFAFDGSRLRPSHPNEHTALDLVRLLLERGADPNERFAGQLHSTSMPNTDRFDNTPFFRAAIAADVETLKLLVAHGADLDQTPVSLSDDTAEPGDPPAAGRGRGNANAGRTAAMVTMTGGRGPGMTGGPGYIRDGPVPYREPGSRRPEDAFALLLESGANPNAKGPDGTPLLHQVARAGNLEMLRALAAAGVDYELTNAEGQTALEVIEGTRAPGAGAGGAAPGPGRGRGGRGATPPQEVARVLRELMGLPPAPAATPEAGSVETDTPDAGAVP